MQVGMIGLGRMGGNMTRRLLSDGHAVVVFDLNPDSVSEASQHGATPAASLGDVLVKLQTPRVVWVMVPAGKAVQDTITALASGLSEGDILIDGGNSYYKDSVRRAEGLAGKGIHFVDAGVSGGVWGLSEGYCLMVGGDESDFHHIEPILKSLAPADGYAYIGGRGAGHFAKMVHNGIEYGMLQAYGEGFELMEASSYHVDLPKVASLWTHGSVVRSWLLELASSAFEKDPDLSEVRGFVEDSGEGRWTIQEAIDLAVPVPAIASALFARFTSREQESFSAKVIAALRHEFGGHKIEREIGQPQTAPSEASERASSEE